MTMMVRRTPVQQRSVTTVNFLLDAAAQILDEGGIAAYTTNAVAARAGISIGSLYQYFPNKDAITAALIHRAHEQIATTLEKAIEATAGMTLDQALEAMLDLMIKSQGTMPRLNRLLEVEEERLPRDAALIQLEQQIETLNRDFFGRFVSPSTSSADLDLAARDIVHIVRALLDADSRDSGFASSPQALRDRVARTVNGYFAPLRAA